MSILTYLLISAVLLVIYSLRQARRSAKLPPGPPRLPLIGNTHQLPTERLWNTFQTWVQQYGPLVSADIGGNDIIIIGDQETARNLLDKRANIYSSRPRSVGFIARPLNSSC
jgi:hypothetical protein